MQKTYEKYVVTAKTTKRRGADLRDPMSENRGPNGTQGELERAGAGKDARGVGWPQPWAVRGFFTSAPQGPSMEIDLRDGKKVAEIIRATPHDGALGKVQFDAKGDVTVAPYVIWVTKGGKFEELK